MNANAASLQSHAKLRLNQTTEQSDMQKNLVEPCKESIITPMFTNLTYSKRYL